MRIAVADVCGGDLVYRVEGARLRAAIEAAWPSGETIEIDFANLRIASASFLDEGVAQMALERPLDEIRARLSVVNITAPDRRLLNQLLASRGRQRGVGPASDARGDRQRFVAAVDRGLADAEAGRVLDDAEFEARLDTDPGPPVPR